MPQGEDPQAPIRVPLAVATNPRNASLDKDALLQNCFIDGSQMGTKYAVKRPGFYVGSEAITTGLNRGIYVNPNNVTGGTPGEVEIWYIGNGLQSFSVSTIPPVNQFRNFSYNLDISYDVSSDGLFQISAYELDTDPPGNYTSSGYAITISSGLVVGSSFDLTTPIDQDVIPNDILTNGTYFIEVKKEGSVYNLYKDSVLYITIPVTDSVFVVPTLIATPLTAGMSVSNLQFI